MNTNCGKVAPGFNAGHDNNARPRTGDGWWLLCDDVGEDRLVFDGAIGDDDGVGNVHENISEFFDRFVYSGL